MWPRQSEKHFVTKFTFLVNAWYLFASLYWLICSLNFWNRTTLIRVVRFQKSTSCIVWELLRNTNSKLLGYQHRLDSITHLILYIIISIFMPYICIFYQEIYWVPAYISICSREGSQQHPPPKKSWQKPGLLTGIVAHSLTGSTTSIAVAVEAV